MREQQRSSNWVVLIAGTHASSSNFIREESLSRKRSFVNTVCCTPETNVGIKFLKRQFLTGYARIITPVKPKRVVITKRYKRNSIVNRGAIVNRKIINKNRRSLRRSKSYGHASDKSLSRSRSNVIIKTVLPTNVSPKLNLANCDIRESSLSVNSLPSKNKTSVSPSVRLTRTKNFENITEANDENRDIPVRLPMRLNSTFSNRLSVIDVVKKSESPNADYRSSPLLPHDINRSNKTTESNDVNVSSTTVVKKGNVFNSREVGNILETFSIEIDQNYNSLDESMYITKTPDIKRTKAWTCWNPRTWERIAIATMETNLRYIFFLRFFLIFFYLIWFYFPFLSPPSPNLF